MKACLISLGLAVAVLADPVPLDKVVPPYVGDGLETAIIPTPKQAKLAGTVLELEQAPICVAPEVLIAASQLLKETGLAEKPRKLLMAKFESERARRQAFRGLDEQWKAASEKVKAKGWPSPLAFVAEIQEAFPGVEFATQLPQKAERPLLLLVVEGMDDSLKGAVGAALPALPQVADEFCAQERYVVLSDRDGGRPRMVSYGATPWAALWGVQTLRQMVFEHGGKRYVRQGTVADYPTLWFRGGKRCKDWWVRYKGNGRFENWSFQFGMRHVPRSHSHVVSAKAQHLSKHREDTFFPAVDIKGLDDKPLPSEGRAIVARSLYDDEALYMAYEVEGTSEEMMKYVRGAIAGELTEENPKKKPVFEIFIKPDLADVVRWQLMHFVPDGHKTFVKHYFDLEDPLGANRVEHTPEIRCSVTGETSYVTEVRIPYWKRMRPATKGDVWGVQLQINRALAHRGTPYWLYHWTYWHDRNGLWAYEYSYGRWLFE